MTSTDSIKAEFFGATDRGCVRTNNEDTFVARGLWGGRYILCAAIDGVGGYEGGEVAAAIAAQYLVDSLERFPGGRNLASIKQALCEANNAIIQRQQAEPRLSQMGCVATAAIIDLDQRLLYMAHVGDSRLYQFSGSVLTKLSHDHSLVGFREEIGDLTEDEAMHHPMRNQIERLLGDVSHMADDPNFIDAAIFPIERTTQYIFCSDGLSDMLTSAQIAAELSDTYPVEKEVSALITRAKNAGGKDNVTVVIARIELPEAPAEMTETSESAENSASSDKSNISDSPIKPKPAPRKAKKVKEDGERFVPMQVARNRRRMRLVRVTAMVISLVAIVALAVFVLKCTGAGGTEGQPAPAPAAPADSSKYVTVADTLDPDAPVMTPKDLSDEEREQMRQDSIAREIDDIYRQEVALEQKREQLEQQMHN